MQDKILKLVMQKLAERTYRSLTVSLSLSFAIDKRHKDDFIKNKTIVINNTSPVFLKNLAIQNTNDEWVKWLLDAFTYGCKVVVILSDNMECFIPEELLLSWPLEFRDETGRKIVMLKETILTYNKIMTVAANSILILKKKQRLTALATEAVEKKKIVLSGGR